MTAGSTLPCMTSYLPKDPCDFCADWIRISNSQAGSLHPSREGTPFQQDLDIKPDISRQSLDLSAQSRSPSPYPNPMTQVVSPPAGGSFPRKSPSPHASSPFHNKPQSPPALYIPNSTSHSSPATQHLPPIITSTENNAAGSSGNAQGPGLGGPSGGLFPPANPALQGLSGLAGISPIAPNADGPMIYIQPSTPISGLKDDRGVFDFKRVLQNRVQQDQQRQPDGYVPAPASHSLSQRSSIEGLSQAAQSPHAPQADLAAQQANVPWESTPWGELRPSLNFRPRAKSDSQAVGGAGAYGKQTFPADQLPPVQGAFAGMSEEEVRNAIDQWRADTASGHSPLPTLDPRNLPGNENFDSAAQSTLMQQYSQLRAQRDRLPPINVPGGVKQEPGQMSPTSMAFYQQLGVNPGSASHLGTASAPFYQSTFEPLPQGQWPHTAGPVQGFLNPDEFGMGGRRRSFAEGQTHPAAGAGTPGYGVEFANAYPFGSLPPGRVRGVSAGHRRTAKSEDFGRPTGWGVGAGGSTADFLNSITANDGTLLPPSRGRSHSRHSSASSVRSASPALSISSQGSFSSQHSPRMDMPENSKPYQPAPSRKKVAKMKVTSVATEMASSNRRTNDGVFKCPGGSFLHRVVDSHLLQYLVAVAHSPGTSTSRVICVHTTTSGRTSVSTMAAPRRLSALPVNTTASGTCCYTKVFGHSSARLAEKSSLDWML